jgi:S-(hydroxymethyl)glutathione dehydrogenase / alcohol dehydrogenase
MRAVVVYEPGNQATVADVALAPLSDGDIRVRIESSGLCHSDVSVLHGTFPAPTPIVIGHEGAGVVEEVGSGVTTLSPGDHVVLSATHSCGRCDLCAKGLPNLCRTGFAAVLSGVNVDGRSRLLDADGGRVSQFACLGTLAEQAVVPEGMAIKIDERVPFEVAAIVGCAVVTGLGAVFHRARPEPGSSAAVIGCGGIGLSVVQGARIAGQSRIIAIDPVPEKRRLATELGATDVIDPADGGSVGQVLELTGGHGVDYAYEAVGLPDLVRDAWDMAAIDGTIVGIGVAPTGSEVRLPAQALCTTEKKLMACVYGTSRPRQDMPMYLDLYLAGRLDLDTLVSRHYELDQINDAVADLDAGRIHGRGVFALR